MQHAPEVLFGGIFRERVIPGQAYIEFSYNLQCANARFPIQNPNSSLHREKRVQMLG